MSAAVDAIVPVEQDDVALLLEAGYLLIEMHKPREAEEVFTGVAALVPHSEVPHTALGHLFFSEGRFSAAQKSHRQAIALNAESAAAHAALAETLLFMHQHDEAKGCIARARSLDPEGPAGQFARALEEAHALGVFA